MANYFYHYDLQLDYKNSVEYDFVPTNDDVEEAIISILKTKSYEEIYDLLNEMSQDPNDLQDIFYDDLYEYFEPKAREQYLSAKEDEDNFRYFYYHDRL